MRLGPIALLMATSITASGQAAWLDAASRSMGGAGIALEAATPYPLNPSSLGAGAWLSVGTTRLFGLPELAPRRAGFSRSARGIRWAAAVSGLSLEGFTDVRLGLATARLVGSGTIGGRVTCVRRRAGPYPPSNGLVITGGYRRTLSSRTSAGIVIARGVWTGSPADETPLFALGAAWSDSRVAIPVEIRRSDGNPLSMHAGMQLRASSVLVLRVGSSTAPDLLTAGFGVGLGRLMIDAGVDRHAELGLSFSLDVRWTVG